MKIGVIQVLTTTMKPLNQNNMKTAVEWLIEAMYQETYPFNPKYSKIFEQAKQMEKNNLYECGSFWRGKENKIEKPFFEEWYNETFKSE
jgi:hypothetical protein